MNNSNIIFLLFTDQQVDRILPAAGAQREAGKRSEEAGQETTVHASGVLGTVLPLSLTRHSHMFHIYSLTFLKVKQLLSGRSMLRNVQHY